MRQNSHAGATASVSEHNAEYSKDSQPDTSEVETMKEAHKMVVISVSLKKIQQKIEQLISNYIQQKGAQNIYLNPNSPSMIYVRDNCDYKL